jgi:cytochrome P450
MPSIPSPPGPPLIGQARELIAGAPRFTSRLADEYGPIVRFSVFANQFYLIADPELAREALVTQAANFPKDERDVTILSRMIGHGLVSANGDAHKRQRRLTQPAFHTRRIDAYAGTMVDYAEAMLDEWRDGQALDVAAAMQELTMYIVAQTLFGAERGAMRATAERVGAAIHDLQEIANTEFTGPFILPEWLPTPMNRRRRAARAVLYDTIDRIIAQRRAGGEPADTGDLLSMLLLSRDEAGDRLSDAEARDQLVTLFVAGHETTSNALTWTWFLLAQHPAEEARLHAEIDGALGDRPPTLADLPRLPYTLQVIKEAMRLYPPAWVVNVRRAAADTTLGPYPIRCGERLWISPFVMHRRPHLFPDPERFDPDRWTPERERALPKYAYLPFGAGPRVCIGNGFALMEAHLIVAAVARRFRPRLQPGVSEDLNAQVTLSNHGGMPVRLEAR